jgi:gliding motility-associated protein GldM
MNSSCYQFEIVKNFEQLNKSLKTHVSDSQSKSETILSNIRSTVEEREKGNRLKELSVEVSTRSGQLIKYIEVLKSDLIERSGGIDKNGSMKGLKDIKAASEMFIGDSSGTKEGNELIGQLDEYITFINEAYNEINRDSTRQQEGDYFSKMTLSGAEDPIFENIPDLKNKTWLELQFDHTPMIAALALLTERQWKIRAYEGEVLLLIQTHLEE